MYMLSMIYIYIYTRCTRAQAHTMMQGKLAGASWQAGWLGLAGRPAGLPGRQAGWGCQARLAGAGWRGWQAGWLAGWQPR